jgi:hypothetical protein
MVDAAFYHRNNDDGSFDSICLGCFLTVAFTQCEENLLALERNHECDLVPFSEKVNMPWTSSFYRRT